MLIDCNLNPFLKLSGLVFFLLQHSPTKENIGYILNFISAVPKHEYLDEVLDLLDNAAKTGGNQLVTAVAGLCARSAFPSPSAPSIHHYLFLLPRIPVGKIDKKTV